MANSKFTKIFFLTVTALWLVTGVVIPCLCPSDMYNSTQSVEPAAMASPEQPSQNCSACCKEINEEPVQVPASNGSHPNNFHCTHTGERLNPGITDDNTVHIAPLTVDCSYSDFETLAIPSFYTSILSTDVQVGTATPALYARTLPLLS